MFNCDSCFTTSKPNEPMHRRVIETRHREYYDDAKNLIGIGSEIVKEAKLCKSCASITVNK